MPKSQGGKRMKEIGLLEIPVPLSYIRKSIRKESLEVLNQQSYKRFCDREDESI